jgi:hypothetical protein
VEGTAIIARAGKPAYRLENINADIEMVSERGPFSARGAVIANGQIFQMSMEVGRISENSTTTLHFEIDAGAPEDPFELTFRGLASGADMPRLQGQIRVAGDDAVAGSTALAAVLGSDPPELPAWLARPYEAGGALVIGEDSVEIDELNARLAGTSANGHLELAGWPGPRLDLVLALPRLDLPDHFAPNRLLAPVSDLTSNLSGEIDLAIGQIAFRGERIRRARIELGLAPRAAIGIREARAVLPGNTDLALTGQLRNAAGGVELEGLVTVVTERFRSLLGWLGADPAGVPSDRLQSFSLTSAIEVGAKSFRMMDAELRVDASHLQGSISFERRRKPRLAATIDTDRLDLDSYGPGKGPADVLALARDWLTAPLLWRGQRWSEVRLDARSIDGKVTLDRLATKALADATADLSGEIDLPARHFDLAGSMTAPQPALLLSRFGIHTPIAFARLVPLTVHGRASGWRNDIDLELKLKLEEATTRLAGSFAWPRDQAPSLELEIEASRAGYGDLLDRLALVTPDGADVADGPLQITGKLLGRLDQEVTFAGTAALGVTRVTGEVAWQRGTPRPRWEARLSLNEPELQTLLPALALAGLRLDSTLLAGPIVGNWPRRAIPLDWLTLIDAEVEISGTGGFAGEGIELRATLKDQRLTVERSTIRAVGGVIEGEAGIELDRPSPRFAFTLNARQIDAAALATLLETPSVVQGRLDLRSETTASGDSLFELVRSLFGHATVHLEDGELLGLESGDGAAPPAQEDGIAAWPVATDLRRLSGRFEIRRGIAQTETLTLDLDRAKGKVHGVIDLLLWVVDLKLGIEANDDVRPPISLGIVGPIDAPQVVQGAARSTAEGTSATSARPNSSP